MGNSHLRLKLPPIRLPPQDPGCRSDEIHQSPGEASSGSDIRQFYLKNASRPETEAYVPPPLISASQFVPPSLIHLLMRDKRDSAIGVKYTHGYKITNMEGAMHTFVTPIVPRCEMMGDYKYKYGHGIEPFGTETRFQSKKEVLLTRSVALSASIQPDFETHRVMLVVAKLDASTVLGQDLFEERSDGDRVWAIPSADEKEDPQKRATYDAKLRAHMVYHLTSSHRLPARRDVQDCMSVDEATSFLESIIHAKKDMSDQITDKFMDTINNQIVSLELLYNTAIQQVINELSALEALFPQGYVYTYDPAVIFAREIGSPTLNRLFLAALKTVSNANSFKNMKTFAINDFADQQLVSLLSSSLEAQASIHHGKIRCCAKSDLFRRERGLYSGEEQGAMLVLHNNSDGFGQNIETEGMEGSLDGAIGASSSAAASLERGRKDLLDFVF